MRNTGEVRCEERKIRKNRDGGSKEGRKEMNEV